MRVALDARWMQLAPRGGVARILANLIPLLVREIDLVLLTVTERPRLDVGVEEHALRTPPPGHAALWLQWSAPRWLAANRVDLFHCPWYGLPFRQPVPMVVTIHDLTFEHHPEWFSTAHKFIYRTQARHAGKTARSVLTVSEHVRADLADTYGVPQERMYVARPAVDPVFAAARHTDPERDVGRPYVLAIGGAPRRNLPTAVSAWRNVRRAGHDVDLVIAGPPEDLPSEPGLIVRHDLPDPEWAALLAGARAFVYPTSDEGFGMPALEAAACGTPVVCARVGSLPEVLGEAAEWCEAVTADAMTVGLERVLRDAERRVQLRAAGVARADAAPDWRAAADITLAAYRAAVG